MHPLYHDNFDTYVLLPHTIQNRIWLAWNQNDNSRHLNTIFNMEILFVSFPAEKWKIWRDANKNILKILQLFSLHYCLTFDFLGKSYF